ncbi:MAG: hypothetical protein ACI9WU_002560 [Myxococcota bacterium]|jgi:hypothetical protein
MRGLGRFVFLLVAVTGLDRRARAQPVASAIHTINDDIGGAAAAVKAGDYALAASALAAAETTLRNYAPDLANLMVEERQGGASGFLSLAPLPDELKLTYWQGTMDQLRAKYDLAVSKLAEMEQAMENAQWEGVYNAGVPAVNLITGLKDVFTDWPIFKCGYNLVNVLAQLETDWTNLTINYQTYTDGAQLQERLRESKTRFVNTYRQMRQA